MKIRYIKIGLVVVLGIVVVALSTQALARTMIKNTRHNLSNWSPYQSTVKGDTTQVCIFCHAPHNADSSQAPLWNHVDTTASFGMASSTNLKPGDTYMDSSINGISRKCLSCHDGTISIGAVSTMGAPMTMTGSNVNPDGTLKNTANGYIQNDLTDGHILAFKYDTNTVNYLNGIYTPDAFNAPSNVPPSMLDREKKMQCHTCHDPHNDWCSDSNKTVGPDPLWRLDCNGSGKNSSVCETCHVTSFGMYTQGPPW